MACHTPTKLYYLTHDPTSFNLVIRPGDPNAEVVGETIIGVDGVKLAYVQPHMHLRGKDYELQAIYPTGEFETLFKGKFDFNWQEGATFVNPIPLPKGTRLVGISHFDNSANNPYNPDPTKEVRWGPNTTDEMTGPWIGLIFDFNTPLEKVLIETGTSLMKPVAGRGGPTLADAFKVKNPGHFAAHRSRRRRSGEGSSGLEHFRLYYKVLWRFSGDQTDGASLFR